jgi:MarR family 2-MHQ and catechol resistance regulon transcriptional repressor
MVLNANPDKTFPLSELGDHLVVTRANITGLIDGLVRDGFVRRIDHPQDRRMVLAQLTDKGRKFLSWFAPQHHANLKKFLGCLSRAEKRQLVGLLDRLRVHIRAQRVEKQRA